MSAPATRKCKDFLVARKLPENDFQKSSKAAELQEAHREMRGIGFIKSAKEYSIHSASLDGDEFRIVGASPTINTGYQAY
jgi:hypothetical protein